MQKAWDDMDTAQKLEFLKTQIFALQRAFRDLVPLCEQIDRRVQELENERTPRPPDSLN
jgi:hypothetical protein